MAAIPDYLNLSLLLRLSNKQQTDIEYELPDDIRKWENFVLPAGYTMRRGTIAAAGTLVIPLAAAQVLVCAATSGAANFRVTATAESQVRGTLMLYSAGSDANLGITRFEMGNVAGVPIEYATIELPT